jgi:hypothetical protein
MFFNMISLSYIYYSYLEFDVIFKPIFMIFILIESERDYESFEQNNEANQPVCAWLIFYDAWH